MRTTAQGTGLAQGLGLGQHAAPFLQDNNTGRGAGRGDAGGALLVLVQYVAKIVVNVCLDWGRNVASSSSDEDEDEDDDGAASERHAREKGAHGVGGEGGDDGFDREKSSHSDGGLGVGGGGRLMEYTRRLQDVVDGFLPAKKDPVVRFYLNLLKDLKPSPSSVAAKGGGQVDVTPPP